jgi:hypothetical protein
VPFKDGASPPSPSHRLRHYWWVADLWLIARGRTNRLTDAETVVLGRVLVGDSATSHVWFPSDTLRPTVVVRDCGGELPPDSLARARKVLGEFDIEMRSEDA